MMGTDGNFHEMIGSYTLQYVHEETLKVFEKL